MYSKRLRTYKLGSSVEPINSDTVPIGDPEQKEIPSKATAIAPFLFEGLRAISP